MSLTWNASSMATGVEEIDAQHRELIEHLNKFFELMRAGQGGSGLDEFVTFLTGYVEYHFRYEESCMNAYRCPAAAANKLAHSQFTNVLKGYQKRLATEGAKSSLVIEIQRAVSDWVRNHLVHTDTHLRGCVREGHSVAR